MKKLLTGIVVLALANMALAAVPTFQINGGNAIELDAGVPLVVPITVSGATGIGAMTLMLETQSPFQITDLVIDKDASNVKVPGLAFSDNTVGATIWTQFRPGPGGPLPAELAYGDVATNSGSVDMNPAVVALVTLLAPADTPWGTTGTITTDNMDGGSQLANTVPEFLQVVQSTVGITVVPEPVSALLLLAGLPLIRRRRA